MKSTYWLKLYYEMLDDPKIGRLNDSSFRLWIECLLLAGELRDDGRLPAVSDISWRLRRDSSVVEHDLATLARLELLELESDGVWKVSNFTKRQAASSTAERMKRYRERKKANKELESDQDTDTDTESYGYVTSDVTSVTNRNGSTPTHPALALWIEVTENWPGTMRQQIIIDRLGDVPNREALASAYRLWMGAGYSPRRIDGILDWYENILVNPDWTERAQYSNGRSEKTAVDEDRFEKLFGGNDNELD